MIERIIAFSAHNRIIILLCFAVVIGWGVWSVYTTPIDAIPDLSDNQVIVFTDYPGRSPQVVEDQVTYPLAVNLQGLPVVKAVRASSAFGFSMIYVIFDDKADIYWARTRVWNASTTPLRFFPPALPRGSARRHRRRPCLLVHPPRQRVRPGAAPDPAGLVCPLPAQHRPGGGRGGLHRRLRA